MEETTNLVVSEEMEEEAVGEEDAPRSRGCGCFCGPIQWVRMLAAEMHWSFVLGVVIVYGISQGVGNALTDVATKYYMKDVQKVQPSESQVYSGIIYIPWVVKPIWGILTDVLPVAGYRRRPYLVLADVVIDACVAQNSISHPSLAADMQSLCALSESTGGLLGFVISGILVHRMGPVGVFALLTIPAGLVLLLGNILDELHTPNFAYRQVSQKFLDAGKAMWTTLKIPAVWRPCVYIYTSIALSLNIRDGMFYWYTDADGGPSFSEETVGYLFSVGSVGYFLGAILFQHGLKDHPFRDMLLWTQLFFGLSGMLDLVLVLRLNLKLGVPDYFFAVIDEGVSRMIGTLKLMPLYVLSSKLCPCGIEGTFFALLMSIENIGYLSASWGGGLLLHLLGVTRTQFSNLWLAILIRNILRISPLCLLFLVPGGDPNASLLPDEVLASREGTETVEPQHVELLSLVNSAEAK
ncbi:hypothetical protein EUGRSUZ_C01893 [Eucalyptus grandis]|uniref:Uncharacterized protein n=2 Tax=Eucalyptus grandis TaxID=71139 RepID=A0ACC3LG97_EUCGR|nr:hypothetical protein EUGRSUZ_C01893 [Eucalyptus grandis]